MKGKPTSEYDVTCSLSFLLLLHLLLQYVSADFHSRFLASLLLSHDVSQMISASHWLLHLQTSPVESDCCCLLLSAVRILLFHCFGGDLLLTTTLHILLENLAKPRRCTEFTLAFSNLFTSFICCDAMPCHILTGASPVKHIVAQRGSSNYLQIRCHRFLYNALRFTYRRCRGWSHRVDG